jgi:tetratricopeptide (TPR) repeat protein
VSDALAKALSEIARVPDDDERWDAAEELAGTQQQPERVAALYREVLARELPRDVAMRLGQRAVRFHDEWLEDQRALADVLARVLEIDPSADWAFHRLSLLFTVAERWDDLLSFYDRALSHTEDSQRRIALLDEAAHIAKDFAGQADRAIRYLEQLFPLRPADTQLATSLERLFEKQGRYRDLINLWTARLKVLAADAAQATRARIAACWLDHLDRPDEALAVTEVLLGEGADDAAGRALLERIGALPSSPAAVRRRALSLLKERYVATDRPAEVVRVLGIALEFAEPSERVALHREIAERSIASASAP